MYHQHSQQQGQPPFSKGPRPPHHPPPPNQQHPNRQQMGFQFPRPTQLPDELESALAIRGARDMDHRQIDNINQSNQHQNQGPASGIGQHGNYGSNPISMPSENQQGVDWSNYKPPAKLFASPPPNVDHQPQQHHRALQQPQNSQAGARVPNWTPPVGESLAPQARHANNCGDGQNMYTPESAGSILASFGLSNEDLEVLSHYPDDQLTPDTLPFILRDIQINKSGKQKTVATTSSSLFPRSVHDMPQPHSSSSSLARSHEVPSLLTVTQTAGKVIDYGHASRAKDEDNTKKTFKREPLSSERTVKMYPTLSSSSSTLKEERMERQVCLEVGESSRHGDRDYRRTSGDPRKRTRSPGREFPPLPKSRNTDRDYRYLAKPRPSSESRSEASSGRSLSSSSGSKPHGRSKKLPTPTMISDFSAVSPKVYPHTCSLCNKQCDEDKDWVEHVNTVNHTAACRDLRNKYPDWKPNVPSRSGSYGSQALWDPRDHSPSRPMSRSLSRTPSPGHPESHLHKPHGRPYFTHRHPRFYHYPERRYRAEHYDQTSRSPPFPCRVFSSSREQWVGRRDRNSTGSLPRSGAKRSHDDSSPPPPPKTTKAATKPGTKAATTSAKAGLVKKKKKKLVPAAKDCSAAGRLVYLTEIPNDASEQEVTSLVGAFGKINNVILMPCSDDANEKDQGQKASVCMLKTEDAQALATSTNLSIRDKRITAIVAQKPDAGQPSRANSQRVPGQNKGVAGNQSADAEQDTSQKGLVLVSGLPESGCAESDIIDLFQPHAPPSDIILASQFGKALVSVPNVDTAEEMVKVHAVTPAKVKDTEVKVALIKQHVSLSTPVALYNLLMRAEGQTESSVPVAWSSLLVISNVPDSPSGPCEVQKLVQRFGTVINHLVLKNMVICEMATPAMAYSVYKRFQAFPCIIQTNPLSFSRKTDPKASVQTPVGAASQESAEDTPSNGKGGQTAAVEDKETALKETCASLSDVMENVGDEKETSTEKTVKDEDRVKIDYVKIDVTAGDALAATEADAATGAGEETSGPETLTETTDQEKDVSAAGTVNEETPAREEAQVCNLEGKAAAVEMPVPQLPKMTQAMVNALLEECRTRNASQSKTAAAPPTGELEEAPLEEAQGKQTEGTLHLAKMCEEDGEEALRKQERERKERDARKEKEVRERERREKERRAWEKEERAKRVEKLRREKERRDEERKEWERKVKERRERKRAHDEGLPGSRSSFRFEGNKQGSWRGERYNAEVETKVVEEEEESDEFPFNMSDFVTVDEIGDVTELPSPMVPMDSSEVKEDAPTAVQQDTQEDTPTEAAPSPVKPGEAPSDSEPEPTVPSAEPADCLSGSDSPSCEILSTAVPPQTVTPDDPPPGQVDVPTFQPEAVKPDSTLSTSPQAEFLPTPAASAGSSSSSLVAAGQPADAEGAEKENGLHSHSEAEKQDKDDMRTGREAAKSEKQKSFIDHAANSEEKSVETSEKDVPSKTDPSLLPFDASKPVGMEFLVPKTGFFCKLCKRFFSGAKEAEINHCKTLKHYENLQKYLMTTKPASGLPSWTPAECDS